MWINLGSLFLLSVSFASNTVDFELGRDASLAIVQSFVHSKCLMEHVTLQGDWRPAQAKRARCVAHVERSGQASDSNQMRCDVQLADRRMGTLFLNFRSTPIYKWGNQTDQSSFSIQGALARSLFDTILEAQAADPENLVFWHGSTWIAESPKVVVNPEAVSINQDASRNSRGAIICSRTLKADPALKEIREIEPPVCVFL